MAKARKRTAAEKRAEADYQRAVRESLYFEALRNITSKSARKRLLALKAIKQLWLACRS